MPARRDPLEKRYYKIREVASLLGVTPVTLRYWEKEFGRWLAPRRNAGGTRFYTSADIDTLRLIHYLVRDKGLRIDAARRQLALNRGGVDRRRQAVDTLEGIRATVQGLIDALDVRLRGGR